MSVEELAYICAGAALVYYAVSLVLFLILVPRYLRRIADALEIAIQNLKKEG